MSLSEGTRRWNEAFGITAGAQSQPVQQQQGNAGLGFSPQRTSMPPKVTFKVKDDRGETHTGPTMDAAIRSRDAANKMYQRAGLAPREPRRVPFMAV